ncbi:Type 2A phosphatase-associated protein 42 [Lecanora helva]
MDPETNIRTLFTQAKNQRQQLESSPESTSALYQENLQSAIASLETCRKIADRISLFSPNETEEDIASGDLQFLLINYYLADLRLRDNVSSRKIVLRQAQEAYERYLSLLDVYHMLSKSDRKLHERYIENRDEFSLISSTDPGARRDTKIARFKQEKELKLKLEFLSQVPLALQGDDAALREIYLAEVQLCIHHTFHALDQIAQELKILALMPPTPPADPRSQEADYRRRNGETTEEYSDRLDPPISQLMNGGKAGPILSKEGKPLRPFTLLDSRQRIRDGVFKPDHSLPTMTIDEYLAEEKRRGGMVDGGGEALASAEPDEDNFAMADAETMKAREWDEFTEANPKGSGNTLNRG